MTRLPLHVNLNPVTRPTSIPSGSGPLSLLSAAIALALGLVVSTDASALALGRLNVQSALGEPLRAEIDVTEISAAEADSMKLNIASPQAFQAAGVAYNSALADVRMTLQRRADGRYVVRLAGNRSLNDPFIDLLLEANWGGGRVVRDYTVLLDPPRSRQAAAPINPVGPQMQIGSAPPVRMASPPAAPPVAQVAPPPRPRPVPAPTPAPSPAAERTVRTGTGEGQQVAVRPGDTASKIAGAYKPADVSLDQMLVAMLRSSPDAFLGGNVNRMKAGAIINVPSAAQATATPPDEARRVVTAQSRDFSDYRQRLAGNAPTSRVARADRQAGGKVQTNVQDRNAAAASPDKLTVSPGGSTAAADEKLAAERQAKDTSTRVAELSKNISELNKLQSATAPAATAPAAGAPAAPAATATTPPAAPTAPAVAPTPPVAATPAPAAPGVTVPVGAPPAVPATAETTPPAPPVAAAPAPAAAKPPAATPVKAPAPVERGFFAELMDNPLMLGAAALIALLIGFLLYRVLGRKRQDAGDSVFLESRIPKDSFFGASGGESVDTKNRSGTTSSLSYSPSQLDAGDVDPVAEADVYLAYGRDLQAEEILREALRVTPERTAIHLKLLEIHAKRRDLRAYEALAADVHKLTGGTGNEWNRVVEMGRELDPGNPLYQPGMRPLAAAGAGAALAASVDGPVTIPMEPTATPTVREPIASPPAFVASVAPLDFDLDLSKPPVAKAPVQPVPVPVPVAVPTPPSASLPPTRQPIADIADIDDYERTVRAPLDDDQHTEFANDFDTAPAALEPMRRTPAHQDDERTQPATLRAGLPGDSGFIEFDMSSMTGRAPLESTRGSLEGHDDPHESPHAIKLSLARELQAIGDAEGARSLIEEVAAEATGDLKAEARQLLTQLA
ncbi:MAG: FimV/HubP family polar landmark protein [Variovorax sp.]